METNILYNCNCIDFMKKMSNNSVDLLLTDIPYDGVNRESNGLRNLDKGNADILTFNLGDFLSECSRITKSTIIIFCGQGQLSGIFSYFDENFAKKKKGTVRQLVWSKTNPSPMNGQYVYLSSIENAIWFKKRGGTFNAHCKKSVFTYPNGKSKVHPTMKNIDLIRELILDNSNENDIMFDPCCGSGTHCLAAKELNRKYIGCELDEDWYKVACERLK